MAEKMMEESNAMVQLDEEDEELLDETQLVIFKLGDEEYGVNIMQVKEIIRMAAINKVPQVPQFVEGIISLRGEILPIIDLREKFGIPKKEKGRSTRILVINLDSTTIGGIVDEVTEVLRIQNSAIKPSPQVIKGMNSDYLLGIGQIGGRIIILLDMARILNTSEVIRIKEIAEELNKNA
ncbi:chemotaxis protein CheW [Petroclostridium xylanilyticum]|jgi:purine-binding chemotaxis protein CheW|uniref:chemotaxis protein CheW n=1 Tax=Petroclostridium xylanilyticum TaxID=1792311 RepID=UPI000B989821|nr:chemotaxis protein CheW [Petroclostridium xylanilyticum]